MIMINNKKNKTISFATVKEVLSSFVVYTSKRVDEEEKTELTSNLSD
jgi:hypothetical protein